MEIEMAGPRHSALASSSTAREIAEALQEAFGKPISKSRSPYKTKLDSQGIEHFDAWTWQDSTATLRLEDAHEELTRSTSAKLKLEAFDFANAQAAAQLAFEKRKKEDALDARKAQAKSNAKDL